MPKEVGDELVKVNNGERNVIRSTGSGREAVAGAIFWPQGESRMAGAPVCGSIRWGKKEAQQLAARTAAVRTEWEDLLERHTALTCRNLRLARPVNQLGLSCCCT
jgi:hypothetical protein